MKTLFGTFFAAAVAVSAQARLSVVVTGGDAPPNVIAGENADFEKGLAGWQNRHSNEVYCVEEAGHGLALHCPGAKKLVNRHVGIGRFEKGKQYVVSCDIKPSKEVSTARGAQGSSGIGCSLSCWDKDWKRCEGVSCRDAGPERWFRISSVPITVPDWAARANVTVGVQYSKGHGLVDNIEVVEVGNGIDVSVESDGAPIRQVKAVDELGNVVFDTGLVDGGKSWSRRIPVESALRIKVYAVDADGDLAVARQLKEESR